MTEEAGFVDVYRHANPDAVGVTARRRIDVPQPMARRRIDYIFLVPGLEVRGARSGVGSSWTRRIVFLTDARSGPPITTA